MPDGIMYHERVRTKDFMSPVKNKIEKPIRFRLKFQHVHLFKKGIGSMECVKDDPFSSLHQTFYHPLNVNV